MRDKKRKTEMDERASRMVMQVEYEVMDPGDKLDYLQVQISESETALRERTDRALHSDKAFNLILENQRYFAVC